MMAPETAKDLVWKINVNNLLTTVSGLLLLSGVYGIYAMKQQIVDLQIQVSNHGIKIDELQKGMNRLNNKADYVPTSNCIDDSNKKINP